MTSDMQLVVYTMVNCPFCLQAKQLLTDRGVPFKEILVAENDDAMWIELFEKSGMKTMPQIFNGEELIGGYTELAALDGQDQLKSLLAK